MSLDLIIGLVGVIVTVLVVVGMILITPREVETRQRSAEPPGTKEVAPPAPTVTRPALR